MLKILKIKNIALIPSLELEFASGLVLLTGETGAGKSIVIDALGLLLGDRASPELIRTGEDKASVEAVFEVGTAAALLEERGLPTEGDEIVLRREIQASGKGRATVNGALVPIGAAEGACPAARRHPRPARTAGPARPPRRTATCSTSSPTCPATGRWRSSTATCARQRPLSPDLRQDRREAERRREMLEFQAAEIEKARLAPGEEEVLRGEKLRQANAGRLAALSGEAYALLYDDENAALGRLAPGFQAARGAGRGRPRLPGLRPAEAVAAGPARRPRAAAARLPRDARGQPGSARRDRGTSGADRAAEEEVRRFGRRGHRVRPAAAAPSSPPWAAPRRRRARWPIAAASSPPPTSIERAPSLARGGARPSSCVGAYRPS